MDAGEVCVDYNWMAGAAQNAEILSNMNHWRIRKAQIADADALASCIDAAYERYVDRISDLPPVSEGCAEDIANHQVWVAIENNKIVGGIFLVPQRETMKLANLAVHPDHAGKGLGRELIALAEREAKKQGFGELQLNTHVAMPENVRFYAHLGWEEISRDGNTVSMRKRFNNAF